MLNKTKRKEQECSMNMTQMIKASRNVVKQSALGLAAAAILGAGSAQAITYANWTFNAGTGFDSSGNIHDLDENNEYLEHRCVPVASPAGWGPSANCAYAGPNTWDGYAVYGPVPGAPLPTDNFTLGLWVRGNDPAYSNSDLGRSSLLASNGDDPDSLWIGAIGGNWAVSLGWPGDGNTVLATFAITPATPQHIEVTREAGSYTVYLDGVLVAGPTAAGDFNWDNFCVGINNNAATGYSGLFGDVILTDVVPRSLTVTLDSPSNGQEYFAGAVSANATLQAGTTPFTVQFFSKKDSDVSFTQVGGDVKSAPYTADLGALAAGTYQTYCRVTDSADTPATDYSTTNTFSVVTWTDNKGLGGTITYTDASGLNPRSSPPYAPGYVVHTFIGSGTLNVPIAATADVLVVGGGGGGGTTIGGGGGAGGLVYSTSVPISAGLTAVVVGAGGAGRPGNFWGQGKDGMNSSFGASLTAVGGGGGAGWDFGSAGRAGGSGGGACRGNDSGGSSTAGQGYAGGRSNGESPGGGGGAGSQGNPGTDGGAAGAGGAGLENAISGVSTWYAGGGGGAGGNSCTAGGAGGSGIGGTGGPKESVIAGTPGVACTGSGGGGGGYNEDGGTEGGKGGSGIVIVRYPYVTTYPKGTVLTLW